MAEKIVVKRPAKDAANSNAQTGSGTVAGAQGARDAEPSERNKTTAAAPAPAKRRKLYVHIGMHKTGTTSIQYALNDNYLSMMNLGYHVPMAGRDPRHFVQHSLLASVFTQAYAAKLGDGAEVDRRTIVDAIRMEIRSAGKPNIIISSENLWHYKKDEITAFAAAFSDYDIEPVLFIRSLADYIDGLAGTMIAHNFFSEEEIRRNRDSLWTSHASLSVSDAAIQWASVAHDKKIWIENYDVSGDLDSVQAFAEIIGVEPSKLVSRFGDVNKSLPVPLTYMKFELITRGVSAENADFLVKNLSKLKFGKNYSLLTPEFRLEVLKKYSQMFARIAEEGIAKTRNGQPITYSKRIDEPKRQVQGLSGVLFEIGNAVAAQLRTI